MLQADPPLSLAERIDAACDKFEAHWKDGRSPDVEEFVAATQETDREALRKALLAIEAELRGKSLTDTSVSQSSVKSPALSLNATTDHVDSTVIPAKIARFEIRSILGSGAFGRVYRGYDLQLGREVAIKVPLKSAIQNENERNRFLKEARTAATINHPNVCQIHEVGEADGRPYIVMALVPGQSLAAAIKSRKEPLPEKQAALVVRKLALALAAAHEKDIVHRDLKPANVMFDRERKDIVVMDFGLARGPRLGDAHGTKSGVIMGTPAYMSPEQASGDSKAVTPASDIFSLGVMMYELLTGVRPFSGTVTEVIGQILHVDPEPPSQKRPRLDRRLEAICLKAMAKDPAARFGTMSEFSAAIDAYLRVPTSTEPATDMAQSSTTRHQGEDASTNTNALAEVFAALSVDRKQVRAETAAAVEVAIAKHRTPRWIFGLLGLFFAGGLAALGGMVFLTRSDKVTVNITLKGVDLTDKSLSFFLDHEPISPEALAKPVELKPEDHTIAVKRGNQTIKKFLVRVEGGRKPDVVIEEVKITGSSWNTSEAVVLTAAQAKFVVPKSFRISPDGRRFGYVLNQAGGHVVVIDGVEDKTVYQQVTDIRFSEEGKDVAIAGIVHGSQAIDQIKPKYEGPLPVVVLNGKRFTPQISYQDLGNVRSITVQPPELLAVAEGRVLFTCMAIPDSRAEAAEFVYADDTPLTRRDRFTGPAALVGKLKNQAAFARRDVLRTVWNQVGIVAGTPDAVFSPNGAAWATVYRVNQDDEVTVNGEVRKKFPRVSGFTFSGDGKRHAYFAERPETQKSYLVVDGVVNENPGGQGVRFAFSPDGSRWAAQTATRVTVDGTLQKVYSAISGTSVAFSPDGKHIAYLATQNNRKQQDGQDAYDPHAFLIVDGKEVKEWAAVGSDLFWSADNRTLGFMATPLGGKQPVVVVSDQKWPVFDETKLLGFSPDGRSFAARVRHLEQQSVVLDGQRRSPYEEIGLNDTRVGFTPSGSLTYFARKGDNSVAWVRERRADMPDEGGPQVEVAKAQKADGPKTGGWVQLFNGRDLSGWKFPEQSEYPLYDPKPANKVKWSVADGAITFNGRDHSHLETVGAAFRQFHLRIEAKTSPGALVRLEFGNRFAQDARVPIDNTRPKWRTGSIIDKINPTGDGVNTSLAKDDEWFTLEVLTTGDRVVTRVNGKRAAEIKSLGLPEGPIRFFVHHDYPAPIFVRKIEYRPLDDEAELDRPDVVLPKQDPGPAAAVADPLLTPVDGFSPLFNAKDTTGWVTDQQGKTWEVRDGKLFAGVNLGFAAMFTEKAYRDFHLRAVVRLAVGASGVILIRANQPEIYRCKYYGIHLNNAPRAGRSTGTITWSSGSSNHQLKGGSSEAKDGKWTLVEVIARGRSVVTKVDGKVVTEYQHDVVKTNGRVIDSALLSGRIGIKTDAQSNGSPVEISRLDIKELK